MEERRFSGTILLMARLDLADPIVRHTSDEGFNETSIPGLRLYRQMQPTVEPMPVVYDPSICVIVQGTKRLFFGGRTITYDPRNILVSALTLPLHAEIPEASPEEPFLGFVIRFDPVQVGTLLAEIDSLITWPRDAPPQTISASPLSDVLARAVTRLIGCLDDAMDRKVLASGVIREILYEVLRGPHGHVLRDRALRDSKVDRAARAVAYVEENFHESLDIETIARRAAMSPSALHQQFKQLTALSPMRYVQHLRLHKARALLLSGQAAAEAGFAVGYNSPSQFSREFRRLFGVPPSRARAA